MATRTPVMPLAAGLFEEGVGSHSPSVSQKTCNARWNEMQTTKGGPLTPNNAVDTFLAKGYTGRCRIYMGQHSPQFALDAGKVHMRDAYDNVEADVVRWWEADVQALQQDFFAKFAAKYDGKISAIFLANGGTIYAEPFMRGISDQTSRQNLLDAGYTADKDKESYVIGYEMCRVFKSTRIAQAFNPWQYVTPDGQGHTDVTFTLQMIDKLCAMFPRRAILQNNSIRTPTFKGAYATMYAHMQDLHELTGRPTSFQTATAPRVGSYEQTVQWAIDQGAHAVELSPGFSAGLSEAQLAAFDKALRANAA